jgi:hypothetical protein
MAWLLTIIVIPTLVEVRDGSPVPILVAVAGIAAILPHAALRSTVPAYNPSPQRANFKTISDLSRETSFRQAVSPEI